jgi:hypothetical protein
MFGCLHKNMYVFESVYTCICVYVRCYAQKKKNRTDLPSCANWCEYIYTHTYLLMYIHIHIHTDIHTTCTWTDTQAYVAKTNTP